MPDKEWEKTQRGKTQKKLDNLRSKWRKRGFKVDITKNAFHNKYIHTKHCQVCGEFLGQDRVVMVGEVVLGLAIFLDDVFIVHKKCQKEHIKVGVHIRKAQNKGKEGKLTKKQAKELAIQVSKKTYERLRKERVEEFESEICPYCGCEIKLENDEQNERLSK